MQEHLGRCGGTHNQAGALMGLCPSRCCVCHLITPLLSTLSRPVLPQEQSLLFSLRPKVSQKPWGRGRGPGRGAQHRPAGRGRSETPVRKSKGLLSSTGDTPSGIGDKWPAGKFQSSGGASSLKTGDQWQGQQPGEGQLGRALGGLGPVSFYLFLQKGIKARGFPGKSLQLSCKYESRSQAWVS